MKQLRDRTVVVTGAASGIGRATALAFAAHGCHLALADVDDAGMQETRALVPTGCRVSTHVVDVADAAAMQRFRDAAIGAHGAVHVVVNNAGLTRFAPFDEHSLEVQQHLIGVNLWGVLHGCRLFLSELRRHDEAHIVNISSMAGFVGIPYQSLYCTTKFAVRGLTQSLRAELADTGVGVTSIHPGAVRTSIMTNAGSVDPALTQRMTDAMLRFGYPAERAGRMIVRAVRHNRAEVRLTPESHATYFALRVAPWALRYAMVLAMRAAGRLRTTPGTIDTEAP